MRSDTELKFEKARKLLCITADGMKSWGLKEINFRTATMIITVPISVIDKRMDDMGIDHHNDR